MSEPTKVNLLFELTSAASALNMPDPEHCPPEIVAHAYEHLMAAIEMLQDNRADEINGNAPGAGSVLTISPPNEYLYYTVIEYRKYVQEIEEMTIELIKQYYGKVITKQLHCEIKSFIIGVFKKMEYNGIIAEMVVKLPGLKTVAEHMLYITA